LPTQPFLLRRMIRQYIRPDVSLLPAAPDSL
jgi:hypothetical protein